MIAVLLRLFRRVCRCSHPKSVHEHYRPGSDCGACGPDVCRTYRRAAAGRAR